MTCNSKHAVLLNHFVLSVEENNILLLRSLVVNKNYEQNFVII